MAITKTVTIDGRDVQFKASAAIPRVYRCKFQRDIFQDLMKLEKTLQQQQEEEFLSIETLEMFENIAYIMAKHADKTIADTPEDWLDEFDTFSIYQVLPQIIELWALNLQTQVESKKKLELLNVK